MDRESMVYIPLAESNARFAHLEGFELLGAIHRRLGAAMRLAEAGWVIRPTLHGLACIPPAGQAPRVETLRAIGLDESTISRMLEPGRCPRSLPEIEKAVEESGHRYRRAVLLSDLDPFHDFQEELEQSALDAAKESASGAVEYVVLREPRSRLAEERAWGEYTALRWVLGTRHRLSEDAEARSAGS